MRGVSKDGRTLRCFRSLRDAAKWPLLRMTAPYLRRWSRAQSRLCMRRFNRGCCFDSRQRPFARAVRRIRAQRRAAGPHRAGAALAAEARRVPPDAVAALNLLRAGPVDVRYQGASFRFYHQTSATERGALLNPDYNIEELDFLRAHTPAGGVFVDVGANAGTYALPLAHHLGPRGRVIAVEPHPVMVARLAFNQAASANRQCGADRGGRRRCRRRIDDRNRP